MMARPMMDPFNPNWNSGEAHTKAQWKEIEESGPTWIEGTDGKRVTYTKEKDGNTVWSKNASADVKRIGNGMLKTEIGTSLLNTMIHGKAKISMIIDQTTVIKTSDGRYKFGTTDPTISQVTVNGKPVGEKFISAAKITIYEAGFEGAIKDNNGKLDFGGTKIDSKDYSMDDLVASGGVHEGTHATDKASSTSLNPKATKDEIEKKPYKNQVLHLKQLLEAANN